MSEKSNKKSLISKGGKIEKANEEDKDRNSVEKQLEKITTDTVIDAMVEYKWLVAKTIATHIIGVYAWDKLSEEDKEILIKRVNDIKLKTPGLM